jgi:hypothetical protein
LRNAPLKEKGASRFSVELNNWSIKPPSTLLLRVKRYAKNIPEDFAAVRKSFDPDAFLATATLRTARDVAYWHFFDLAPCPLCRRYRGKADMSSTKHSRPASSPVIPSKMSGLSLPT